MPERDTATLDLAALTADSLDRIRQRTPLVHSITNFVVMNDTANALLAIGASPVMAHAIDEVREMVGYAGALVLNIGTLEDAWVESMLAAGLEANRLGTPVVLDPVGAGATKFRTATVEQLLDAVRVAIVRGNAGELATIAGHSARVRGVDSVAATHPDVAVKTVAARTGGAAVASGATDFVADARRLAHVRNGHPFMSRITGSGCMATAIAGAFAAVEPDPFLAALEATIAFGIAGEMAAGKSAGPGTFRANLIDAVANLDRAAIVGRTSAQIVEAGE